MDSIKVAENLAAGSVVKEVQIILENGGEANYSIALVSGKFAIDNAKFSFDVDGNIINNNILASGIYWIRYRATVGFNSVEKGLKIYTDDQEVEITLSSTEYPSDILNGEVVSTVSLSSGSTTDVIITPQSDSDDAGFPAFDYDGASGEIRWSGNQTPEPDPLYSYIIQYTGECIKPSIEQLFTVTTLEELGLATCSYPGLGTISGTSLTNSGARTSVNDDFVAVKALLDSSSHVPTNETGPSSYFNNITNTPQTTRIARYYFTMDTTGITEKIACKIVWSSNKINREFVVLYTTATEPAVNNVTYDMSSWTVLGSINNPTSATEAIEFDMDALPRNATLRFGIMLKNDYENDPSAPMSGERIITNGYRLGSVQFYKCS